MHKGTHACNILSGNMYIRVDACMDKLHKNKNVSSCQCVYLFIVTEIANHFFYRIISFHDSPG